MSEKKSDLAEGILKYVNESLPMREPLKLVIQLLLLRITPDKDPEMWEVAWAAYRRLDDFDPMANAAALREENERLREESESANRTMAAVSASNVRLAEKVNRLEAQLADARRVMREEGNQCMESTFEDLQEMGNRLLNAASPDQPAPEPQDESYDNGQYDEPAWKPDPRKLYVKAESSGATVSSAGVPTVEPEADAETVRVPRWAASRIVSIPSGHVFDLKDSMAMIALDAALRESEARDAE